MINGRAHFHSKDGIETPLSSVPNSPEHKPMDLKNPQDDKMDVDNNLLGGKASAISIDVNLDLDKESGGMNSLEIEGGSKFYEALEKGEHSLHHCSCLRGSH